MINPNRSFLLLLLVVVLLLCIPFVAMRFTPEVAWSVPDFLVAGTLLVGTGLLCGMVMRRFPSTRHRLLLCGMIVMLMLLVWVELAVGVFGTPFAGS